MFVRSVSVLTQVEHRLRPDEGQSHPPIHRSRAKKPVAIFRSAACVIAEGRIRSGWTPLKKAKRLAAEWAKELYIKDDSCNSPTFSYKKRVVSVSISKAIEFGFDTVACASTGNLANSTAAHAATAGLRCYVMIPHDLERGKVVGSQSSGRRRFASRETMTM